MHLRQLSLGPGKCQLAGLPLNHLARAIASNNARGVPFQELAVSKVSFKLCAPVPAPPPLMVMAGIFMFIGTLESVEPSRSIS
jgi:hypothetical protein